MSIIRVAGIDPAFANMGIARILLNLETMGMDIEDLILIETEKEETKKVRVNSDDLRRATELHSGMQKALKGCVLAFAEIPSGAQDAKSARGLGIAVGVIASSPVEIVEVQPAETKLASVGSKTATKPQMIAWATNLYPDAPWKRVRDNPAGAFTLKNEHLADAVAVAYAGIRTPEFKRMMAVRAATGVNH